MAWQDILNNFKQQFQTMGPEKYSDIQNPDLRYELAGQRSAGLKAGFGTAAEAISKNVQESQKAAESAAAEKKAKGYYREYNKSGGYTFYDPDGNAVSPFTYALANGVPLTKALEGSYDPGDRQFVEDYTAMSEDLASGRYDQKTAIDILAKDYPQIFTGKGTPTGGTGYRADRTARGIAGVQSQFEQYTPAKKDNAGKIVKDFATKVGSFQSYQDADYALKQTMASDKRFQKLDKTAQNQVLDQIGKIIDEIFPPRGYDIGMGLY